MSIKIREVLAKHYGLNLLLLHAYFLISVYALPLGAFRLGWILAIVGWAWYLVALWSAFLIHKNNPSRLFLLWAIVLPANAYFYAKQHGLLPAA